ncbi:septum formation family protein [Actinoplanes sp. NPDC020271]|uniref:septum formation family protein n=1 Tax=Actinoplanes sp. NPDC020271 TaxID=3363896 RepID=UPI0037929177
MPSIRSAAVAAAALLLLVTGCDSKQPQAAASPSPSAPAPYTPAVGTCFNFEDQRDAKDSVPCDTEHQFEVAYVGPITYQLDIPPLEGSERRATAYRECRTKVDAYVGGAHPGLLVKIEVGYPSDAAWRAGSRWYSCDVSKESFAWNGSTAKEFVTGSVKNAYANPAAGVRMPCAVATQDKAGHVTDWTARSCSTRHTVELVGLVKSTSKAKTAPRDDDQIADACFDLIAAYLKVPVDDEEKYGVNAIWFTPSDREWEAGERRVRCYLHRPEHPFSGSLAGAGPSGL